MPEVFECIRKCYDEQGIHVDLDNVDGIVLGLQFCKDCAEMVEMENVYCEEQARESERERRKE